MCLCLCLKKTSPEEESEKLQKEEKTDSEKEPEKKKRKIGCTDEEVLAVLSHELGHWKLNHILKNLAIGQVRNFFKMCTKTYFVLVFYDIYVFQFTFSLALFYINSCLAIC